jgi:hypothetical protein
MSFPSLANLSFPRPGGGKQPLLAGPVLVLIVAACGGSAQQYRLVEGLGYSFDAPAGWKLVRTPRALGMQDGDVDLVQVTRLPLARPYRAALFPRVVPELDAAARQVADESGAVMRARTVRILGDRVRQYDLHFSGRFEQLTFVLRGKRNYQLLCRRDENADEAPCMRLVSSFRIG